MLPAYCFEPLGSLAQPAQCCSLQCSAPCTGPWPSPLQHKRRKQPAARPLLLPMASTPPCRLHDPYKEKPSNLAGVMQHQQKLTAPETCLLPDVLPGCLTVLITLSSAAKSMASQPCKTRIRCQPAMMTAWALFGHRSYSHVTLGSVLCRL